MADVQGIWLEVSEVRCESRLPDQGVCEVRLKGDREEPKIWWPVAPGVLESATGDSAFKTRKAIQDELDKKHVVAVELRWNLPVVPTSPPVVPANPEGRLECRGLRFLGIESGAR